MVKRGHTVYHKKSYCYVKKYYGSKNIRHIMPDLPGSSPKMDLEVFRDKIIKKPYAEIIPFFGNFINVLLYFTTK